jgi:hypothetical protein
LLVIELPGCVVHNISKMQASRAPIDDEIERRQCPGALLLGYSSLHPPQLMDGSAPLAFTPAAPLESILGVRDVRPAFALLS